MLPIDHLDDLVIRPVGFKQLACVLNWNHIVFDPDDKEPRD